MREMPIPWPLLFILHFQDEIQKYLRLYAPGDRLVVF